MKLVGYFVTTKMRQRDGVWPNYINRPRCASTCVRACSSVSNPLGVQSLTTAPCLH
jgi:hypothetical protein